VQDPKATSAYRRRNRLLEHVSSATAKERKLSKGVPSPPVRLRDVAGAGIEARAAVQDRPRATMLLACELVRAGHG